MIKRILFRLKGDHLLVANTGTPFSKEGLESICYSDTSAKTTQASTMADSVAEARKWVDKIITEKKRTFVDPNQLRSASGTEKRTAKDYSSRLLLELLQNAVDAGREEQIGNKGIGFRSVLNGSRLVEIHSRFLHVRWSDAAARGVLDGFNDLPETLPILDLPQWHEPDAEIEPLCSDYDTIVRLVLNEEGVEHITKEWDTFTGDRSLLLFIDGKIEVRWERPGSDAVLWERSAHKNVITLEESNDNPDHESLTQRWRCFGESSAKAAFSIDADGRFVASNVSNPRLRAYFPASHSHHPFPNLFLHNAKFSLESNRESVQLDGERLAELGEVITLAANSLDTEGDVLDLLRVSKFDSKDKSTPTTLVWNAASQRLIQAKLKGLRNRTLAEIKSCPKSESLGHGWLGELRWKGWTAFLRALEQKRSNGLADLPMLPPGVENEEREETLLQFSPNCQFSQDELQKVEWAPVEDSKIPVSSSAIKVFLPHKGEAMPPPEGIKVRFLDQAFVKVFRDEAKMNVDTFLTRTLGVEWFSAIGVIEHCVLNSSLVGGETPADDKLIQFLKKLRESDGKESKKPVDFFDWDDLVRRQLVQQLHLQLQGQTWPLLKVYASEKWTGNGFLELAYGESRGYLEMDPPPTDAEKAKWEEFWKWLGVGWSPKVLPLLEDVTYKLRDHKGWEWLANENRFSGSTFQQQKLPPQWNEYCKALRGDCAFNSWDYRPRLKANWTLDGNADVLGHPDSFQIVEANWSFYRNWTTALLGYSRNKQKNSDNQECKSLPSFLTWLMRSLDWVPCKGGRLHSGRSVYRESGPVAKELPDFVPILSVSDAGHANSEFLKHCGIRTEWSEVGDKDWKMWLEQAAAMSTMTEDSKPHRDAVRALYGAVLDRRTTGPVDRPHMTEAKPLDRSPLWAIERQDIGSERWHLIRTKDPLPYFVDRSDVANEVLPGLCVFPVRLDGLEVSAMKHFNLPLLSAALSGTPNSEGDLESSYSDKAWERIDELTAYLRKERPERDDEELRESIGTPSVRKVSGLRVQFSLNGTPFAEPVQRSHFVRQRENQTWVVYVDPSEFNEDDRWGVFSEALLLSCRMPVDRALNVRELLRCSDEDISAKLVKLGVAPETVDHLRRRRAEETNNPRQLLGTGAATPPSQGSQEHDKDSDTATAGLDTQPLESGTTRTSPEIGKKPGSNSTLNERKDELISPGSPSGPHPEKGMAAQAWLFQKIQDWCQEKGKESPKWEKDRVDITIPGNPKLQIEAKRIEGMAVHWSSNQIRIAQEAKTHGTRYVVALLRPKKGADDDYEVYWVFDPLAELASLSERSIEWAWSVKKGAPFRLQCWKEPEPRPSAEARSFHAEIKLTDDWVEKLPAGVNEGLDFLHLNAPPKS